MINIENILTQLRSQRDGVTVYNAGLPRFPRNFTRDGIIAALLADDAEMMRDQLTFCATHQGTQNDPQTGEEPGKIHHEMPGYPIRDRMTTYNACDACAFYLIGHQWLQKKHPDQPFLTAYRRSIEAAAAYIVNHLNEEALFEEDSAYCGADRFALKVTYWKDSVILDRPEGEPVFPAVFTLAHIQNLAGLRAAAALLDSPELAQKAAKMKEALISLFDPQTGTFLLARDQSGPIAGISSDGLHALYYLEPGDIPDAWVVSIERASEQLESHIGYLLLTPEDGPRMVNAYHADTVWPFEQALIHAGAGKFGLKRVQRVCERVARTLTASYPELLEVKTTEPAISSNPQLWTISAKRYFQNHLL